MDRAVGDVHDRVHVPGGGTVERGYDDTAMGSDGGGAARATWEQRVRPRAASDPEPPAGMPKWQAATEAGRHREGDAQCSAVQCKRPAHVHAGGQGRLQGREGYREGKATYREPRQTPAQLLAAGGRAPSPAGLPLPACLPAYTCGGRATRTSGRCRRQSHACDAMRARPTCVPGVMARPSWLNPAKGMQTRARLPLTGRFGREGSLVSCTALQPWGPPAAAAAAAAAFARSVCRASAAPTRIIGRSLTTGCRISRGWLPARRGLWVEGAGRRWQLPPWLEELRRAWGRNDLAGSRGAEARRRGRGCLACYWKGVRGRGCVKSSAWSSARISRRATEPMSIPIHGICSPSPATAHRVCVDGRAACEAYNLKATPTAIDGTSWQEGLSVGGEARSPPLPAGRGATPNPSCQGASHTYLLAYSCFLRGTVIYLSAYLSLAGWLAALSSVFCAALHARAHRSGIFRPSSVSSLAVPSGAVEQAGSCARLSSASASELSLETLRNAGDAPCALARYRSWYGLNLPQATTPETHPFANSRAYFRAQATLPSASLAGARLTSFAPKHVMAHGM